MLHALTQLNQVLQDVLGSSLLAAYVAAANSTQKVPVGHDKHVTFCMLCCCMLGLMDESWYD